jgi:hypothetical protein
MTKRHSSRVKVRRANPKGQISNVFGALKRKKAKRLSLRQMKEIVETTAVERRG